MTLQVHVYSSVTPEGANKMEDGANKMEDGTNKMVDSVTEFSVNNSQTFISSGQSMIVNQERKQETKLNTSHYSDRQEGEGELQLVRTVPVGIKHPRLSLSISEQVQLVNYIKGYKKPNIYGARVPIESNWNIPLCYQLAQSPSDREVVQFLQFGWSLNHDGRETTVNMINHATARNHQDDVTSYIRKELNYGCLLGPFYTPPWD